MTDWKTSKCKPQALNRAFRNVSLMELLRVVFVVPALNVVKWSRICFRWQEDSRCVTARVYSWQMVLELIVCLWSCRCWAFKPTSCSSVAKALVSWRMRFRCLFTMCRPTSLWAYPSEEEEAAKSETLRTASMCLSQICVQLTLCAFRKSVSPWSQIGSCRIYDQWTIALNVPVHHFLMLSCTRFLNELHLRDHSSCAWISDTYLFTIRGRCCSDFILKIANVDVISLNFKHKNRV